MSDAELEHCYKPIARQTLGFYSLFVIDKTRIVNNLPQTRPWSFA